ncbi:MAG: polysaccharide deacetylase family protein [Lachnospiraceae bacterium]|nr:polysaccharide deacetylase family protein [Lachnospiraceae bacterium]
MLIRLRPHRKQPCGNGQFQNPIPSGNHPVRDDEDTSRIVEILAKHDMCVTFLMTGRWMNKYPDYVKAILGDGSIILMHNGAKYTADALDSVITILKEKGYEFVPISELILRENFDIDHEGRQFSK